MGKATVQVLMTIKHLRIQKKVPPDIEKYVLDLLQTTTVPKFISYFKPI